MKTIGKAQVETGKQRHRLTIDLRGTESRLRALAAARHMTLAAAARQAILCAIEPSVDDGCGAALLRPDRAPSDAVKVTLRLPAAAATKIAARARAADLSQGAVVAALVEGLPPSATAPDRRAVLGALKASSSELASLCVELLAVRRSITASGQVVALPDQMALDSLSQQVRRHLELASRAIAEVSAGYGASGLQTRHEGRREAR